MKTAETSIIDTAKTMSTLSDGVAIKYRETFTVFRCLDLEARVKLPQVTYLAAGSIRGGSSILGYMLHSMGLISGENIHPTTHEDLDFEQAGGRDEWKGLIEARDATCERWALKLPVIAKHLHFFQRETRNPVFMMIVRNPAELAFSIMEKDARFSRSMNGLASAYETGNDFYAKFFAAIEKIEAPVILVNKEKVDQNPESFVRDFCELLDYETTEIEIAHMVKGISTPGYKTIG